MRSPLPAHPAGQGAFSPLLPFFTACAVLAAHPRAADPSPSFDIRSTLDALPRAGGVVRIPAGTCELTRPLTIRDGGIRLEGADETYLHGVAVERHGGIGIVLRDCSEDPRLVRNIVTDNAAAGLLLAGGHDVGVSANRFDENQDAVRCPGSFNLKDNLGAAAG